MNNNPHCLTPSNEKSIFYHGIDYIYAFSSDACLHVYSHACLYVCLCVVQQMRLLPLAQKPLLKY
jgi:hypothetical protein